MEYLPVLLVIWGWYSVSVSWYLQQGCLVTIYLKNINKD